MNGLRSSCSARRSAEVRAGEPHAVPRGGYGRAVADAHRPSGEPARDGERHEFEVEFADGKAPARVIFALVAPVSGVDTLISVVRQEPAVPACPAEVRAQVRAPEDLLLLGYMGKSGVPTARIEPSRDAAQGLESLAGVAYRGKGWQMFQVRNPQHARPAAVGAD